MKAITLLIALVLSSLGFDSTASLKGSWSNTADGTRTVWIFTDGFFTVSIFSKEKFISTYGGSYLLKGNTILQKIEFDTQTPERIGTEQSIKFQLSQSDSQLIIGTKKNDAFTKADDGTPGKLAGAWLITGRFSNNEMSKITPGARRTMKILSGTRFQWIAYNVETKEFFGTGGGTYTTENGKYTENIDFFSRDQSRVGMSLGFDFSVQDDGSWRHSGKSSKGDPIDEVWTQREKLGM
jgi:hypothetical protein